MTGRTRVSKIHLIGIRRGLQPALVQMAFYFEDLKLEKGEEGEGGERGAIYIQRVSGDISWPVRGLYSVRIHSGSGSQSSHIKCCWLI